MMKWFRRIFGDADSLGERGEKLACRFLRRQNYRILHRNLRLGDDEADIVALSPDQKFLVVVEVKTRTAAEPGPEIAVNHDKQRKLARLAARLLKKKRYENMAIRFDVIAIVWPVNTKPELKHYEAAFDSPF